MVKRKANDAAANAGDAAAQGKRRVRFDPADEGVEESKGGDRSDRSKDTNDDADDAHNERKAPKAGTYDEDEEEDTVVDRMTSNIEGEEEDGDEKFNEVGEQFEPFNLKGEREEGYFDVNGNFVWRKEGEEPDAWLAGLDEGAMEEAIGQAANAQHRKDLEEARISVSDDPLSLLTKEDIAATTAELLQPNETVLKALKRYAKKDKQLAPEQQAASKKTFERLTELSDQLLQRGVNDVYQMDKNALLQEANTQQQQQQQPHVATANYFGVQTQQTNPQHTVAAAVTQFEYMGKDGNIHGPFPLEQVYAWISGGYFSGENTVMMRPVNPNISSTTTKTTTATNTKVEQNPNNSTTSTTVLSGADELLADFDDDDDDDNTNTNQGSTAKVETQAKTEWVSSDTIDFSQYT